MRMSIVGMYKGISEISDQGTHKLKVYIEKGEKLHVQPYVLEVAEK
jgi:hypothetical protein